MSETNGELTALDRTNHRKDVKIIQEWIGKGWQAGEAFQRIKDRKSYLDTHQTFDKFCLETFGVTARRVDQLICACEVRQSLRRILPVEECEEMPEKPSHLEALGKVDDETAAEIWEEVLEESKETDTPVTAAKINQKVKIRKSVEEKKTPKREPGEDEPEEMTAEQVNKAFNLARNQCYATMDNLQRMVDTLSRNFGSPTKADKDAFHKIHQQAMVMVKQWKLK